MDNGDLTLFAPDASRDYGEKVARHLGVALAAHEERAFEDGEHKGRPLVTVRGRDAFVVQSLHGGPQQPVNEKLVRRPPFFIAARRATEARRSGPASAAVRPTLG